MKSINNNSKNNTYDPTSPNYDKEVNNKGHEKSPYGENEPSPRTTYK
ncbi:hypothetical protein JCM1393_04990 [Clostridium carnis]